MELLLLIILINGLSLVLGGGDVKPIDMAEAYSFLLKTE
jgi:membrane carboxypeptidase/penicillin-binding protein PbpC